MIVVIGYLIVDPDRREGAIELSLGAVGQARETEGCVDFAVSADPIDPARINVAEQWRDRESLNSFRGEGTGGELEELILSAHVSELEVADSASR